MYPTNQYMGPYYYHYRNHSPYPYYPPPGWEAGHPRAMDSSYRPPSYGPWPYNAGMSHPRPSEFHCCCNHNQSYPTGYYGFRPPFPQELPPPHLYYLGPVPQHPNEYPSHFGRPHPYPVEQTPYDYNKFNSHCCGCPNHVCHGGEKSSVKIEEERPHGKPETELKGADNSSLIRYPNNQYPVIWLPPRNMEDKEMDNAKIPPHLLNGWVPVGGKWAEDGKQQGTDDQKDKRFQWPIAWMPAGYAEAKQKAKEVNEKDKKLEITEETPSPKIKIFPLSWFEDQKPAAKSVSRDHSGRSAVESQHATTEHRDGAAVEGHHETTPAVPRSLTAERKPARENYKTITVLPEKEADDKKVATCRTIPVMTQKENDEKKPVVSENKEEKKASSARKQEENVKGRHTESTTAKHSKLPPVCLRVDPLPRKKQGNGSSRSPSPPMRKDADKAKKDMNEAQNQNLEPKQSDDADKAKKDMNEAQNQNLEPKQSDTEKHITVSRMKETSSEELKNGKGFSNETVQVSSAKHPHEEVPASNDHQNVQASSTSVHAQENAGASSEGDSAQGNEGAETLKGDDQSRGSEASRTNLSEADAAVRIQSAYRGYDVRRWQPLDKLRKIRDVHEQMHSVREQLQSLETSSKKPTEKEQVAIGEAIMNLLLKLDTIQGLHPCVREARKSVTRELICLQEKLDSVCNQPSSGLNHTNENERLDRAESVAHATAPTLTVEASDKEEKSVGLSEAEETSPVISTELCDAMPSEANLEVGKDTDPTELKNQEEKSCTSTMEVPREREKAAEEVEFQGAASADIMSAAALPEHPHVNSEQQIEESDTGSLEASKEEKAAEEVEFQGASSADIMSAAHLPEHPHDNNEHLIEESDTGSLEASKEEKAAEEIEFQGTKSGDIMSAGGLPEHPHENNEHQIEESGTGSLEASKEKKKVVAVDEGLEVPLLDSTGPDATPAVGSCEEEKCMASIVQSPHSEEPNTGVSPVTGDIKATLGIESLDNRPAAESDGSAEDQTGEAVRVERSELKQDGSPADESRDVTLEDAPVSLKDIEEPHEHDPTAVADSVASNVDEQSVEARSTDVQEQVADSTQDSTREQDGTLEASMGPTSEEPAASEEPAPAASLESTSKVDSVSEQTVLDASNNAVQSDLPGKDDVPHVDQKNEVLELTGGLDVQESDRSIAEGADSRTKTVFPEFDSSESEAEYERIDTMVPLKCQATEQNEDAHSSCADAQASNTDERTETLEAPADMGANAVDKVEARVSETEECNGTLGESTIRARGVTSAEAEAANLKEDVGVQTERKASQESLPASITPDGVKDSDEKKLVEETQKLRVLLQKLLASGNDQMDVITDLSEKVKVLERKLARKKKPRVRVHRPARHTTARVH